MVLLTARNYISGFNDTPHVSFSLTPFLFSCFSFTLNVVVFNLSGHD